MVAQLIGSEEKIYHVTAGNNKMQRRERKQVIFSFLGTISLLLLIGIAASQLSGVREFLTQASSYPAQIEVDVQAIVGIMPRPWRNLAQGGESHAWRIQPITSQVAALKPEYIRLDHIYDFYDIVHGSPGNLRYDWTKLDLVLNDIRSVGATPFISLSYTPPVLSTGDITGQPTTYNDWASVVQQTIQHISGTLGFRDVYYEVWNEPDLFGNWKYYGDKNYLDLYTASAQGASRVKGVQPFKLGGPATTALYENWLVALLTHAQKNNLQLDFLSWHRYSTDLDQFRNDMSLAKEVVSRFPRYNGLMELLITEWGHDSDINSGYDTVYGAAHTIAGAINMLGVVERGFVFEIQDGYDPAGKKYWGRWGLLTAPDFGGQAKPRYYALQLLDSIADQRVQTLGQGSFVKAVSAVTENGAIQTVLANFDSKGRNREVVPITYRNIVPGNYQLQTKFLNGNKKQQPLATTSAELQAHIPMGPNDVVMVELVRQ